MGNKWHLWDSGASTPAHLTLVVMAALSVEHNTHQGRGPALSFPWSPNACFWPFPCPSVLSSWKFTVSCNRTAEPRCLSTQARNTVQLQITQGPTVGMVVMDWLLGWMILVDFPTLMILRFDNLGNFFQPWWLQDSACLTRNHASGHMWASKMKYPENSG